MTPKTKEQNKGMLVQINVDNPELLKLCEEFKTDMDKMFKDANIDFPVKIENKAHERLRICVIGSKGSGKTTYIKDVLLPKLRIDPNDCLWLDMMNKYNYKSMLDFYVHIGMLKKENLPSNNDKLKFLLLTLSQESKMKLIILDHVHGLDINIYKKIFKAINPNTNFIITSHSVKNILPFKDKINMIFNLGTLENEKLFKNLTNVFRVPRTVYTKHVVKCKTMDDVILLANIILKTSPQLQNNITCADLSNPQNIFYEKGDKKFVLLFHSDNPIPFNEQQIEITKEQAIDIYAK